MRFLTGRESGITGIGNSYQLVVVSTRKSARRCGWIRGDCSLKVLGSVITSC